MSLKVFSKHLQLLTLKSYGYSRQNYVSTLGKWIVAELIETPRTDEKTFYFKKKKAIVLANYLSINSSFVIIVQTYR